VQLQRKYNCTLQVGGGDQWGNIVSGVGLNRRVDGVKAHALTCPLVTDAQGQKFGKCTGGGRRWLDPDKPSAYSWYQYFLNAGDAVVIDYVRGYTVLAQEERAGDAKAVEEEPFQRAAQRRVAQQLTNFVHGEEATEAVELAAEALF